MVEVELEEAFERPRKAALDGLWIVADQLVTNEPDRSLLASQSVGERDRAALDGDVQGALIGRQLCPLVSTICSGRPGSSSQPCAGSLGSRTTPAEAT